MFTTESIYSIWRLKKSTYKNDIAVGPSPGKIGKLRYRKEGVGTSWYRDVARGNNLGFNEFVLKL